MALSFQVCYNSLLNNYPDIQRWLIWLSVENSLYKPQSIEDSLYARNMRLIEIYNCYYCCMDGSTDDYIIMKKL
jgi:hypothetical protein